MHTIALSLITLLTTQPAPAVNQNAFDFLAGSWKANIWGGVFEETWTKPIGNSVTQMGRHTAKGKLTFMEFGSVEKAADGSWAMFLIFGEVSKQAPAVGFKLTEAKKGEVLFVNAKNEFPTHIRYTSKSKNEMTCVIYGRADGKEEREVFNFKRVK
jgi:hypothetical protein